MAAKIPRLFSEYYESVMVWAGKEREARVTEALKKSLASEDRVAGLSDKAARATETKRFLEGDFWIERLEPFLRSRAVLRPAVMKSGEANPVDRINVAFLIDSGRVGMMVELIEEMEKWQAEGAEAEKVLALEAEKRQRLRETRA